MKRKLCYLTVLILLALNGYSQVQRIQDKISSMILLKDGNYFETGPGKNGVIAFSYAIGIDSKGNIDTIQFSNSISRLHADFINLDQIKTNIKKQTALFKDYKNTVFFGMILLANGEQETVKQKELYMAWPKLLENLQPLIEKKELILFNPVYKLFYHKRIN